MKEEIDVSGLLDFESSELGTHAALPKACQVPNILAFYRLHLGVAEPASLWWRSPQELTT